MKRSKQMRLMQNPLFLDLLELHRLDCAGSNGDMASYSFARNLLETTPEETVKPKALLDGHAVMKLLGIGPGPVVGRILAHVNEQQLEGTVTDRKTAEIAAMQVYLTLCSAQFKQS
jgi:poly(A) polymerase